MPERLIVDRVNGTVSLSMFLILSSGMKLEYVAL